MVWGGCAEAPESLPSWAERWVSLLLAASLFALQRRLATASAYLEQLPKVAVKQRKHLKISEEQWRCWHPRDQMRPSGNQHGSFVHCKQCGFRLLFLLPEERERVQGAVLAARARSRAKAKARPVRLATEATDKAEGYNTDGRVPTKEVPPARERATRPSANSSSSSGLEQALLTMAQTQQEQGQMMFRQLESMSAQQLQCTQVLSQAMGAVQLSVDRMATVLAQTPAAESSHRDQRRKTSRSKNPAESFVICSDADLEEPAGK